MAFRLCVIAAADATSRFLGNISASINALCHVSEMF